MDLKPSDLHYWRPIRIYPQNGKVFVDWVYVGETRFTDPFYDNTVEILTRRPFNSMFRHQTPIEFLGRIYQETPGAEPKGFIFHVSRCGSTLVTQMLSALGCNIVISEPSVTDKLIRAEALPFQIPDETRIQWLRWMVNALGQKRSSEERNLFIKFDSWSVLDLPLIERAFPEVPWIFMYREPVEVIVSNLHEPGAQMIPGAIARIFPGMDLPEILQYPIEERCARTIAAFCRAGLANAGSPRGKLINYSQMPGAMFDEICPHFGFSPQPSGVEKMKSATTLHAKRPGMIFNSDSERKRREASEKVQKFADELVRPLFDKLEDERRAAR